MLAIVALACCLVSASSSASLHSNHAQCWRHKPLTVRALNKLQRVAKRRRYETACRQSSLRLLATTTTTETCDSSRDRSPILLETTRGGGDAGAAGGGGDNASIRHEEPFVVAKTDVVDNVEEQQQQQDEMMTDVRLPLIPWKRLFSTRQTRHTTKTDEGKETNEEEESTSALSSSPLSERSAAAAAAPGEALSTKSRNDDNGDDMAPMMANTRHSGNGQGDEANREHNQTQYFDPLEPLLESNNDDQAREKHHPRQRPPSSHPAFKNSVYELVPALALRAPSSSSFALVRAKLITVLKHPQTIKWTLHGLQLTLVVTLVNAIAKAAAEVLEEMGSSADVAGSPSHLLKVEQVQEIIASLDASSNNAATATATTTAAGPASSSSSSSILEQQPTLQYLTDTLLASGMPLRASQEHENSIEQVLLSLTKLEASLLQQCLWTPISEASPTTFADITGLNSIKQSLLDLVWTIKSNASRKHRRLNPFSHLVEHPPGVLLYGPPGCGKTLLVRALAGAANLPCLVVTPSVLLRKYVGDTNLHVRALFSLAQKLAPSIMCVDELDGLFRERSSTEHDVSRDLKTEFLQHWDGITTKGDGQILIVGASNRPFEVDSAVLRRMPQSYFVGLPNYEARKSLLSSLLKSVPTTSDLSLHPLAAETEGYSPSDLKQVVRMAITMGPIREARFSLKYRPLSMKDVAQARSMVSPTPLTPGYRSALMDYAQRSNSGHVAAQGSRNPWDSFYNAGTIHAASPSMEMETSSDDGGAESHEEDDDYSYDQDSESDGLDD